ncbi:MAG: ATP-grasp domain-containing protein [Bacteroidales bacterium]
MTGKRCCILFNQPRDGALPDELDVLDQVELVSKNLNEIGVDTYRAGITSNFMAEVEAVALSKPDFVFNLVESINNKGELCYFVPALLNMHSLPYSGNPVEAMFITTSKALTAKILYEKGINSPHSFFPSQYKMLDRGTRYIIKPVWEDGSMGITDESVFTYEPGAENRFKGFDDSHWIIQEYIDGREFNISVLKGPDGPEVMPAAEMVFRNFGDSRPKIVDFKAKWDLESFEYENTVREFPGNRLNPALAAEIKDIALKCWHVFGLKGYARVDIRVDSNEKVYVIEVNANPCISPDSGLVAAINYAGLPMTEVLKWIISDLNT